MASVAGRIVASSKNLKPAMCPVEPTSNVLQSADISYDPKFPLVMAIRNSGTMRTMASFGFNVFTYNMTKRCLADDPWHRARFLDAMRTYKPDVLFFSKDECLLPGDFLRKVKSVSPTTKFVMLYWDQRGCVPLEVKSKQGTLDAIIINNADPNQVRMYHSAGIRGVFTLYDSANAAVFVPQNIPRKFDVIFGGSHYGSKFPLSRMRFDLVNAVRQRFHTVVHGVGWNFPTQKILRKRLYCNVLQSAKINLGINHYNVKKYYEERIVECLVSGRMHMTYYIPGMEDDFVNHKHLVWFRSVTECLDLLQRYLRDDRARERIAAAGRERAITLFNSRKTFGKLACILKCVSGVPHQEVKYP